jgi:1-acyl-sn-glycerol-3-phosphate acyltransferase
VSGTASTDDASRMRRAHAIQRLIGWCVAPIWVPAAGAIMRWRFGYRIEDVKRVRREFRRIRAASDAPLLICGNHLTLIDSFLVAWALRGPWSYVFDYDTLPWNTPEETNFAFTPLRRVMVYLGKCIPIRRGGDRQDIARVLARLSYALERREAVLLFPEGGRSRSGRVEESAAAWGVGRIVGGIEGCRVLCVYMRGRRQESFSDYPAQGDSIHVDIACIEPKSDHKGARRSRDLAQQIVGQLIRMEDTYFEGGSR